MRERDRENRVFARRLIQSGICRIKCVCMCTCVFVCERGTLRCRVNDLVGDLPHDVRVYVCARERDSCLPGD